MAMSLKFSSLFLALALFLGCFFAASAAAVAENVEGAVQVADLDPAEKDLANMAVNDKELDLTEEDIADMVNAEREIDVSERDINVSERSSYPPKCLPKKKVCKITVCYGPYYKKCYTKYYGKCCHYYGCNYWFTNYGTHGTYGKYYIKFYYCS